MSKQTLTQKYANEILYASVVEELKQIFSALEKELCDYHFHTFEPIEVSLSVYRRKIREGDKEPGMDRRKHSYYCIQPQKILRMKSLPRSFLDRRTRDYKYSSKHIHDHFDDIKGVIIRVETYTKTQRGTRWSFTFSDKLWLFYCDKCSEYWTEWV